MHLVERYWCACAKDCGYASQYGISLCHRFLKLLNEQKTTSLVGIVEADEIFVLESFKDKKHGMTYPPHKRGAQTIIGK